MGAGELNRDVPNRGYYSEWHTRHPILQRFIKLFAGMIAAINGALSVVFAQWPSMHDPIKYFLNIRDAREADILTEKWVEAKLRELNYVGTTSALITGTIAAAFTWFSLPDDPWSTRACWTSALLLALTAISVATQQTIGLSRLCSCEYGWLKVRCLLGEDNPAYGRSNSERGYLSKHRGKLEERVKMKKSQLWIWQTPVMLSNFSILLFIIGLMISVFDRAMRALGNWANGDMQVAIFFAGASAFCGFNYLVCWIGLNQGSLHSESEIETHRGRHPSIYPET